MTLRLAYNTFPAQRPDFRCHALLHRAGHLWGFGLRHMVLLAPVAMYGSNPKVSNASTAASL